MCLTLGRMTVRGLLLVSLALVSLTLVWGLPAEAQEKVATTTRTGPLGAGVIVPFSFLTPLERNSGRLQLVASANRSLRADRVDRSRHLGAPDFLGAPNACR